MNGSNLLLKVHYYTTGVEKHDYSHIPNLSHICFSNIKISIIICKKNAGWP